MRPGPCSLSRECSGRSKLFKPLTRCRVRKMSPERFAVEPPEPPKSPGHGAGTCKGRGPRGLGRERQPAWVPPQGLHTGHVSGVQSRWAPALMTGDGEGEGEGQEEPGVGGYPLRQEETSQLDLGRVSPGTENKCSQALTQTHAALKSLE